MYKVLGCNLKNIEYTYFPNPTTPHPPTFQRTLTEGWYSKASGLREKLPVIIFSLVDFNSLCLQRKQKE